MPKVSIVVPIYNSEKELPRCIDSILRQTYSDFELILINDGSKDGSLNILKEYEQKDKRVIVIDNENNGVSETRNIGIRRASGDYIAFVDSDDYIENNMMEALVKSIEEQNADLVICGLYIDVLKGQEVKTSTQTFEYNVSLDKRDIALKVLDRLNGTYINSPINKLYKKSILIDNNIYMDNTIDLGEDLLFNIEYLSYCSSVIFEERCFYHYCMKSEDSLTAKYRENKLELMKRMYDGIREYMLESRVTEDELYKLDNLFIKFIYSVLLDLHNSSCKYTFKEKLGFIQRVTRKYRDIIDRTHNLGYFYGLLKLSLKVPILTYLVSKMIYIVKNRARDKMYG